MTTDFHVSYSQHYSLFEYIDSRQKYIYTLLIENEVQILTNTKIRFRAPAAKEIARKVRNDVSCMLSFSILIFFVSFANRFSDAVDSSKRQIDMLNSNKNNHKEETEKRKKKIIRPFNAK